MLTVVVNAVVILTLLLTLTLRLLFFLFTTLNLLIITDIVHN